MPSKTIDYGKIFRLAFRHAKRNGHSNDAEDFAQECCIYAFEKQTDEIFIRRRFSDYLRRNYDRKGTSSGDALWLARGAIDVYDDETHGSEPQIGYDDHRGTEHLSQLSRYERLIYVLSHKYDIPLTQIADSQGVSLSRISQVLKGIQQALHKKITRKESGISRNGEAEMERIFQTQRERMERGESCEMEKFESFALESFDATGL